LADFLVAEFEKRNIVGSSRTKSLFSRHEVHCFWPSFVYHGFGANDKDGPADLSFLPQGLRALCSIHTKTMMVFKLKNRHFFRTIVLASGSNENSIVVSWENLII
jgi:hypothetical protein